MAKVAWIGLGVMGYPMAGPLSRAGHDVTVHNRSEGTASAWCREYGGTVPAPTPAEAARDAQFVFSCVGNDDDAYSITAGPDGTFAAMQPGAVHVDCTTTSAALARNLHAQANERGLSFLDAPVSGGQAGAQNGSLTVMVGGDQEDFDRAQPLFTAFAGKVTRMGPCGAGQTAKMVNQLCIAGVIQGLAEGMNLAAKAGLDVPTVMDAVSSGAAGSWQLTNRWQTMNRGEYGFGFAVDWMRKDLGIAISEANRLGASVPLAALVDQFYGDVQAMGGGRWDTSSLLARLDRNGR